MNSEPLVCRLAVQFCYLTNTNVVFQDYHRFHAPVTGKIMKIEDIPGMLFTVISLLFCFDYELTILQC